MKILINGIEKDVPFDLADITVWQWLDFQKNHGRKLFKRLAEIERFDHALHLSAEGKTDITPEDIEKEKCAALNIHAINEASAWYTYWTGFDFYEAKDISGMPALYELYSLRKEGLNHVADLTKEILFDGKCWVYDDFKPWPDTRLTLSQITRRSEVYLDMYALKRGVWKPLPRICAVFFRKKGEPFTKNLVEEGSERLELMNQLPMSVAMAIVLILMDEYNLPYSDFRMKLYQ